MFTSEEKKVIVFLCALFIVGGILRIAGVKYKHAEVSPRRRVFKVNINKAGIKELEKIPLIGPKTAQEIVNYRKSHKSFNSLQDLGSIEGIGKKKLNIIKKFIVFKPN